MTIVWYCGPMVYIDGVSISSYSSMTNEAAWGGVISILLISGFGPFIGRYMTGLSVEVPSRFRFGRAAVSLVAIISAYQFYLIYTGVWKYGVTLTYASNIDKSQWNLVISFACRPILVVVSLMIADILNRKPSGYIFGIAILLIALAVQFIWLSIEGRRIVAINVAIAALFFIRSRRNGEFIDYRSMMYYGIVGVSVSFLVYLSWSIYFVLRQISGLAELGGADVFQVLSVALTQSQSYNQSLSANFASRPFALMESFVYITQSAGGFTFGLGALTSAFQAVPSLFWPSKASQVLPDIEHLWTAILNLKLNDWSNTLLLEGYVDFWWVGFYLHIAIIAICGRSIIHYFRGRGSVLILCFAFASWAELTLSVETSATAYFVWIRNFFAIAACYQVLLMIRPAHRYTQAPPALRKTRQGSSARLSQRALP